MAIDLDGEEEAYRNYISHQKEMALVRVQNYRANEQALRYNFQFVQEANASNKKWTSEWKNSKNFFAKLSYSIVNGFYTTGQQLSSSIIGQEQIQNIGGGSYDAKGPFGEKQRVENFVNSSTMLVPAAPAEELASKALGGVLNSKLTNNVISSVERNVTEQAPLLTELADQGIKYTAADILHIGKSSAGKVVFLEKGNARSGLQHILNHADEFLQYGISKEDIGSVVFEAVTKGKQVGLQKSTRPIYQIMYKGEAKNIAVTVGENGYIVGANPVTKIK